MENNLWAKDVDFNFSLLSMCFSTYWLLCCIQTAWQICTLVSTGFLLKGDAYLQPNTLRFEISFTGFGIGHKLWIHNGRNTAHHWSVLYHLCSTAVSSGGWALIASPCWCTWVWSLASLHQCTLSVWWAEPRRLNQDSGLVLFILASGRWLGWWRCQPTACSKGLWW